MHRNIREKDSWTDCIALDEDYMKKKFIFVLLSPDNYWPKFTKHFTTLNLPVQIPAHVFIGISLN